MKILPKTRTSDILENEAGDELMVYDLRTNRMFQLNETSKNVYKACNGMTTFDYLRNRYRYTDDLINFAIDELTKNNLIEDYSSVHFAGMTRRDVIRKVGLSCAIALPVISGLTAPPATNAASGTCANRCVQSGTNACVAGCAGRTISYVQYTSRNGSCTGAATLNAAYRCPADGSYLNNNIGVDILITP